jgi:hypothetical protein
LLSQAQPDHHYQKKNDGDDVRDNTEHCPNIGAATNPNVPYRLVLEKFGVGVIETCQWIRVGKE